MTEILEKPLTKTYTKQQVEKATLEYFKGDKLATDVWIRKYCLKDENNYYELTPDDMHWRLAHELSRIEAKYPNPLTAEQIYNTLKHFQRIVPQGSPMSGIGNDFQVVSLSNCFVIGDSESDSYGGIFKVDQEQVQLMKRRGGVGHDLSHIRPKGSSVKKQRNHQYGNRAIHGTLFEQHQRSCTGWQTWCTDVKCERKTSRLRGFHRCQNDRRQGHWCKCQCETHRRVHERCTQW